MAGGNRPNGYFGPNMRFLVPEPATVALIMLSGVGMILRRKHA